MDIERNILDFCKKYKKIYVYGAGNYGSKVLAYLNINGIAISGFVVSAPGIESEKDGVFVYAWEELRKKLNTECGVIVALSEQYHADVLENILGDDIPTENIFVLRNKYMPVFNQLYVEKKMPINSDKELEDSLFMYHIEEERDIHLYENKIRNLLQKYHHIELQFVCVNASVADMVDSWIYCVNWQKQRGYRDIYYLYLPHFNENFYKNQSNISLLCPPNQFLIEKLQKDNIEIIHKGTLSFWQYAFDHYREKFDVKNGYSDFAQIKRFNDMVRNGKIDYNRHYVTLTENEEKIGENFKKEQGIGRYVCLFARDNTYYRDVAKVFDGSEKYRTSDINKYEDAARYLNEKNISAIRVGSAMSDTLSRDSIMVDYATKYRTELLDIYLFKNTTFCTGDDSGILMLCNLFGTPIVSINNCSLSVNNDSADPCTGKYDLMLLIKYFDTTKNRYLTLREQLEIETRGIDSHPGYYSQNTMRFFDELGLVPIKNTKEEILEVVREMVMRLNGEMKYDALDEELQQEVNNIKNEYKCEYVYFRNARIGRDFLRKNRWLLG